MFPKTFLREASNYCIRYAYSSLRACGEHMPPDKYYKTCERFEKTVQMSKASQADLAGCGIEEMEPGKMDTDTKRLSEEPTHTTFAVQIFDNYEPAYLRFACGHGQDLLMPKCTFQTPKQGGTGMSERMLFCGCYAGNVPKIPVSGMIFVEGPISNQKVFKPVWEITGPCWKFCNDNSIEERHRDGHCRLWGKVVDENRAYDEADDTIVNPNDPALPGNHFSKEREKVEHFLAQCKEWEQFEEWKTVALSGDINTCGMRMKAASRYAGNA